MNPSTASVPKSFLPLCFPLPGMVQYILGSQPSGLILNTCTCVFLEMPTFPPKAPTLLPPWRMKDMRFFHPKTKERNFTGSTWNDLQSSEVTVG